MKAGRICVVDDDPHVRGALSIALADAGFLVDAAADVEAALASMRRQRPDVVIADLQLPGVGDGAVVARFRRTLPGLPIIAMSGNETLGPIAMALGASAFLRKPCAMAVILDCIERVRPQA